MLDWRILAVTAPIFFVGYQALTKLLPKGTSTLLIGAYALAVGAVMMLGLYLLTGTTRSLQLPSKSLLLSLGMGAGLALGNFGLIKAYSLGAPQSSFTILFYISLIIYGILFGFILWHEKLRLVQIAGIALACIGVFLAVYFRK